MNVLDEAEKTADSNNRHYLISNDIPKIGNERNNVKFSIKHNNEVPFNNKNKMIDIEKINIKRYENINNKIRNYTMKLSKNEGKDEANIMKFIRIAHYNVANIVTKIPIIDEFLSSNTIDIFCVTEHWMIDDNAEKIVPHNFRLIAKYCRETKIRGGSCIYVNKSILSKCEITEIDINQFCHVNTCEACAIRVKINNQKDIIILTVYRIPKKENFYTFLKQLDTVIEYVQKFKTKIILCGDLNVEHYQNNGNRKEYKELCDVLGSYNLENVINFQTRGKNGIDYIIVDSDIKQKEEYIIECCDNKISDHKGQIIQ